MGGGRGEGDNGRWAGAGGKSYLPYTDLGRGEGVDIGRWAGAGGGHGRVTASGYISVYRYAQMCFRGGKNTMC